MPSVVTQFKSTFISLSRHGVIYELQESYGPLRIWKMWIPLRSCCNKAQSEKNCLSRAYDGTSENLFCLIVWWPEIWKLGWHDSAALSRINICRPLQQLKVNCSLAANDRYSLDSILIWEGRHSSGDEKVITWLPDFSGERWSWVSLKPNI